jgi:probable UDP-sugar transporter A4
MIFSIKSNAWNLLLILQVISYGSYSVLVHLCEINGRISFDSTSMNFLIEMAKLIVSVSCYFFENMLCAKEDSVTDPLNHYFSDKKQSQGFNFRNSLAYVIPAGLYFINNNLAVYIQLYMDSTSYQVLSNLKILTTAVLYYLIIGKKFNNVKILSLVILFFAGVLYSIGNLKSHDINSKVDFSNQTDVVHDSARKSQFYVTQTGFVLILFYCTLSGFAGVYNEFLLKRNFQDSIYMQNIYLYMFGSLFNLVTNFSRFKITLSVDEKSSFNSLILFFFNGFNIYTWLIIGSQVFNGIAMSIVIKHSSNITRLFVISCSMFVTTLLSVLVFNLQLNFYFYTSFGAIVIALYLYSS